MGILSSTSVYHARIRAPALARGAQHPRYGRTAPRRRRARCALRFHPGPLSSLTPPSSFAVCCVPGRYALPAIQQPPCPAVRAIQRAILHLLFIPGHVGMCTLAVVLCVDLVRAGEHVPVQWDLSLRVHHVGYARGAVSVRSERPRECVCVSI
jgi:hypothetical protein